MQKGARHVVKASGIITRNSKEIFRHVQPLEFEIVRNIDGHSAISLRHSKSMMTSISMAPFPSNTTTSATLPISEQFAQNQATFIGYTNSTNDCSDSDHLCSPVSRPLTKSHGEQSADWLLSGGGQTTSYNSANRSASIRIIATSSKHIQSSSSSHKMDANHVTVFNETTPATGFTVKLALSDIDKGVKLQTNSTLDSTPLFAKANLRKTVSINSKYLHYKNTTTPPVGMKFPNFDQLKFSDIDFLSIVPKHSNFVDVSARNNAFANHSDFYNLSLIHELQRTRKKTTSYNDLYSNTKTPQKLGDIQFLFDMSNRPTSLFTDIVLPAMPQVITKSTSSYDFHSLLYKNTTKLLSFSRFINIINMLKGKLSDSKTSNVGEHDTTIAMKVETAPDSEFASPLENRSQPKMYDLQLSLDPESKIIIKSFNPPGIINLQNNHSPQNQALSIDKETMDLNSTQSKDLKNLGGSNTQMKTTKLSKSNENFMKLGFHAIAESSEKSKNRNISHLDTFLRSFPDFDRNREYRLPSKNAPNLIFPYSGFTNVSSLSNVPSTMSQNEFRVLEDMELIIRYLKTLNYDTLTLLKYLYMLNVPDEIADPTAFVAIGNEHLASIGINEADQKLWKTTTYLVNALAHSYGISANKVSKARALATL